MSLSPAPESDLSSLSSSASSSSPTPNGIGNDGAAADGALALARMIEQDAERVYLLDRATELDAGTSSEKRRIRREARAAGLDAYIGALEQIVQTNEAEKSTLQTLLDAVEADTRALRCHAASVGVPIPLFP